MQMVMAVFAYIYHQSFVVAETLSVEMILELVISRLLVLCYFNFTALKRKKTY